jgi:UDP-glucose 4-epimerase
MTKILIAGGAGFIGSHTCLVLLEAGHELVVLDNYANSSPEALRRVVELAGPQGRLKVRPAHPWLLRRCLVCSRDLPLRDA